MSNDSFIFYNSFFNAISLIPEEHRLKCYEAICNYAINGDMPSELDSYSMVILTMAKPIIDSNAKKRNSGSKGGRPKGETIGFEDENHRLSDMETIGFEDENHRLSDGETIGFESENHRLCDSKTIGFENENHRLADAKPNVNVNVNVNADVNADDNADDNADADENTDAKANGDTTPLTPRRGTQEQLFDRVIEDQNVGLEMEGVLREWLKYKSERRETYKETGMRNMVKQVQNAVHRFGEVAVMDRIRHAMANTWKGMNLDKMEKPPDRRMNSVNDMIDRWAVASEEYERRANDTS